MRCFELLGLLALWLPSLGWGQPVIRLKTVVINTRDQRELVRSQAARRHLLLQFASYPGPETRAELAHRGIRVLAYVPDFALMVSAGERLDLAELDVTWAGALQPAEKLSPLLASGKYDAYLVELHPDANREQAAGVAQQHGFKVVETPGLLPNHILLTGPGDRLESLAADDDVAYLLPARWDLLLHRPTYHCPGPIAEAGPTADYVLQGPGWAHDSSGNVSLGYFFDSLTTKVEENTVRSEIQRAFEQWALYANVSFTAAQQEAMARSIDILFASGAHGDAYPFNDPSVLAHTFYPAPSNPEPVAGDMHFNNAESWNVGSNIDLFSVALHEAGHALGLAHSDNPEAVMYPYYKMSTGLTNDDIAGIQALYGARGSAAPAPSPALPSPAPPSPAPAPTPTPAPTAPPSPPAGSDHTPPSLAIVSPSTTIVSTYSTAIQLSGTASDNVAVTKVVWSTSTGGSGTASGTANWTATVPLLVGDNVVTLRAYDAASNSTWRAITVVRH